MKPLKIIKTSLKTIWYHPTEYIKSILFLQGIRLIVALPLITFLFYRILAASSLNGITETTIYTIFKHPWALFFLLLLALVSLFFIYYELGYYFLLAHFQQTKENYRFRDIIKKLNQKAKYFISFQLLFFFFYFILILPIASIGLNAALTENLRIPNFITDELAKSTSGMLLYLGVLVVLFYLSMRLIYTVPFFVIETNLTIWQAIKKSWNYSRLKLFKALFTLGILILIHSLIVAFVLFISFLPLIVIEKILNGAAPVIAGITLTFIQWFLFIFYGLLQALLADALTHLAYPITESSHFEINREQNPAFLFKPKRFMYWGVFAAFLGMSIVNTFSVSKVIYQPTTAIIAHRGYTAEGVENTISSLDAAARIGADYVEMDIQETKDHQFVVFHDSTLSRLSNRSERISDLTLAELQKIDVSSGGFTDKIPSFEDYIAAAKKDNIKLLVEIKLHGRESKDMEKNLVALLQKEKVTETYLVQSLDEATIKKVKKLDPVIKTGYLVALNIGNLPQISADFLVLEEFSFNTRLLEQARQQDKMVFVWTVNDEDLMRRYLALDVDGLITNYPSDAIEIRDSFDENKTFVERIEDLLN